MSKKLPVNGFKWLDNDKTAEPSAKHVINEEFIKMTKMIKKDIFSK